MKKFKHRRGAISLEYAVLIACVVAGLIAMRVYIIRGMEGRMRQAADNIGEQYVPGNTIANIIQTFNYISDTLTNTTERAGITNTVTTSDFTDIQRRVGSENAGSL